MSVCSGCRPASDVNTHERHYGAVGLGYGALVAVVGFEKLFHENTHMHFSFFSYDSSVAAALAKQKSKEDPEQENPSDVRDPSVEGKERLLALDKPICDEEDETIAQDVANEEKERGDSYRGTRERKLVCVDETSKLLLFCFETRILRGCCNTSVILFPTFFSISFEVSNTFAIGERGIFFQQNDKDKQTNK